MGETLYREPMERLAVDSVDIKKPENISGEACIQSSNANARVLVNLQNFWLILLFQMQ